MPRFTKLWAAKNICKLTSPERSLTGLSLVYVGRTMRLALLLSVIGLGFFWVPGTRSEAATSQPSYALATVRMINTAESLAHRSGGKFLPLDQLISSGPLKQAAEMNPDFSSAYSQM